MQKVITLIDESELISILITFRNQLCLLKLNLTLVAILVQFTAEIKHQALIILVLLKTKNRIFILTNKITFPPFFLADYNQQLFAIFNPYSSGRKICKLRSGGPFYGPMYRQRQSTNNNPPFGHIVCQPLRSLQVWADRPDRPHVKVKTYSSL